MSDSRRPLRVLQVTARYLPDLGGTETHVHEVGRRLGRRDDLDLTVLTTDRTGRRPRVQRAEGFDVLRRQAWPRGSDYHLAPGLVNVIRRGGWDLVHLQGVHTAVPILGMLAARRAGIPYVVTFHTGGHSSGARTSMRSAQWKALSPLLRDARRLIGVSRFERDLFQGATGISPDRFTVIRNGGGLPTAPAEVRPIAGRIVSSGRLERYKGHHRVIEALAAARRRQPEAHLVILGAGPFEADLRALADRLGVGRSVTIRAVPPGDRDAMARELASATVVAALSDYEAHPVGVMEALALGVPVVGYDVAGTGDLVADGLVTGLAPETPAERVADALLAAARTRRTAAVDLPTWESCADELATVYRTVVDEIDQEEEEAKKAGKKAGKEERKRAGERPARVVHVITALTTGGAERQVQHLVERGSAESTVICLYGGGLVADDLVAAGHRVHVLGMAGWRRFAAPLRLARMLRRLRPDVVHTHLLAAQFWGLPAARLAGVPVIVSTEHSLMPMTMEGRPTTRRLRLLYYLLVQLAQHSVAVSAATARRMVSWGINPARMSVILNGTDIDAMAFSAGDRAAVRAELGVAQDVRLVGAVGRLAPVKRFDVLIDALAPLLSTGDTRLLVVGVGPQEGALRRRCAEHGISDAVHFLGARSDVARVLSALDVFVSPSRDETFGLAILEALANGLPTVYGECPGLEGLPKPLATAIKLPAELDGNAERAALAEAVDAVLDTGLRADHPPADLRAHCGVEGFVGAVEALYRSLSAGRRTTFGLATTPATTPAPAPTVPAPTVPPPAAQRPRSRALLEDS
ncbi:glycosyltransferase [Frankia sp. ACN1ag]|uniref:glycosyltransferase family 4 protein n=2 Tax=unclassified Frankia TaxID=2632575 RepID=UPI0006DCC4FC|nr:glycosyltransferase [Frankia sp. ACN1ag]